MSREMRESGCRKARRGRVLGWLASGVLGVAGPSVMAQGPVPPPNPVPFDAQAEPQGDPGVQILTRGPIHEAFAESIAYNPAMSPIVPKAPPAPVEELPPDQKPEGGDVEWIPGYWAWDDQRNDFIWISGIWRDIPPGRQWVPGYWVQAENGFQWTSGFWTPVGDQSLTYLPQGPPQTLENGPNSPQPGENAAWIPGSWSWQDDRYLWRPGYWIQTRPDWIWMPSRYVPTPSGYVYVDGYWDYPLAQRGLNFAPVAFAPTVLSRPNYSYTPVVALAAGGLLSSLFVRPNQSQYYFGDYYNSAGYGPGSGYVPWFGRQQNRSGYDPIYSQMSVINARREPNWDRRIRDDYQYRFDHNDARPAPTFLAERARLQQRQARGEDVRNLNFARPLNQFNQGQNNEHRLVAVDQAHRAEIARRQVQVQQFREARQNQEAAARRPANVRAEDHKPQQISIARSPIVAGNGGPGRRPQGPNLGAPPERPEQHNVFRPAFQGGPQGPNPGRGNGNGNGNNNNDRGPRPNQGPNGGGNGRPGGGGGPPTPNPQPAPNIPPPVNPQPNNPQPGPRPQPNSGPQGGGQPKGNGAGQPKGNGGGGGQPKGNGGGQPKGNGGGGGGKPKNASVPRGNPGTVLTSQSMGMRPGYHPQAIPVVPIPQPTPHPVTHAGPSQMARPHPQPAPGQLAHAHPQPAPHAAQAGPGPHVAHPTAAQIAAPSHPRSEPNPAKPQGKAQDHEKAQHKNKKD